MFPPGLWVQKPKSSSIPRLVLGTIGKLATPFAIIGAIYCYGNVSYTYSYPNFKGKSISMGHITRVTHEPLSTEEIDRLKREQAERRKMKKSAA